jgi:mono/diheme cytochrome c family protein
MRHIWVGIVKSLAKHGFSHRGMQRAVSGSEPSWLPRLALALGLFLLLPASASSQEAAAFFKQNCFSCHTVGGGRLVGPDLKDVSKRKDREWLGRFILDPQNLISRGDAYALQILEESRGVVMPTVLGISRDRIEALLDLIEAESRLEKSQFAGVEVSDRPFTSEDIVVGREYFLGTRAFKNGGPACVSCHTVLGIGGLGGGRLGPDLSKAYERIGGRKPLVAWLFGPATTTMKPIYSDHALEPEEILPLVAHMEHAAQQAGEDTAVAPLNFLLLGLGGAALALVAFDGLWSRRFRAVRRPLVEDNKNERAEV